MGDPNKYGLKRSIPAEVKREVRQRCGFGCVRCGLGIYDYEHFAPDFKDARSHDPAGITLLCMQCNQKRARGLLSAETVAQANDSPRCLQDGFAREEWGFGKEPIEVVLGGATFTNVDVLIQLGDKALMSVRPPEEGSHFYRLSCIFADKSGQTTLTIEDNEWFALADNWDVECVGPRITIRSAARDVSLVLRSEPPHRIVIEKIDMQYDGFFIRGDPTFIAFSRDGEHWFRIRTFHVAYCTVGVAIPRS
jgi:hypothetical protein